MLEEKKHKPKKKKMSHEQNLDVEDSDEPHDFASWLFNIEISMALAFAPRRRIDMFCDPLCDFQDVKFSTSYIGGMDNDYDWGIDPAYPRFKEEPSYMDLKVFYDVVIPLMEMDRNVPALSLEPERSLRRALGPSLVLSAFVYDFGRAIRKISLMVFRAQLLAYARVGGSRDAKRSFSF